jgi:hypothetical protein
MRHDRARQTQQTRLFDQAVQVPLSSSSPVTIKQVVTHCPELGGGDAPRADRHAESCASPPSSSSCRPVTGTFLGRHVSLVAATVGSETNRRTSWSSASGANPESGSQEGLFVSATAQNNDTS